MLSFRLEEKRKQTCCSRETRWRSSAGDVGRKLHTNQASAWIACSELRAGNMKRFWRLAPAVLPAHTHTAISGQRDWQQPAELASQELQHLCMPRAFPGGDDLQHTLCTCSTDGGTDPRNTTLQVLVALLCLPIV